MKDNPLIYIIGIFVIAFGAGVYLLSRNTPMVETSYMLNPVDVQRAVINDSAAEYKEVTPPQAKKLIDAMPELVIIDVSPDYANGHIPRAINFPLGDGSLDSALAKLDKSSTYLVYCHTDQASIAGTEKLVQAGFTNVYRLSGNYSGWVEAGYAVET